MIYHTYTMGEGGWMRKGHHIKSDMKMNGCKNAGNMKGKVILIETIIRSNNTNITKQ